jgi:DNA-directed RNA polymerase subunit RPC12/RpoP
MNFGELDNRAYYSCIKCGHDFIIDLSKYAAEITKKERSEDEHLQAI